MWTPAPASSDVVCIDPPWKYGKGGRKRTAEAHYKTIGNGEKEIHRRTGAGIEHIIAATPISAWARPKAMALVWTTNPKLPFTFPILSAWNFDYITMLTWVKTTRNGNPIRNGQGWYFRGCTEHIVVGVRGRFAIPSILRRPNLVETHLTDEEEEDFMLGVAFPAMRTGVHSEKPTAFYELIEGVTPGADRLDVYARQNRPGWRAWGDEAPSQGEGQLSLMG